MHGRFHTNSDQIRTSTAWDLEGNDGSLVIVDYKTDDAPDAALPSRVGYYAPQLNAYRSIVETAIHKPTSPPVLVFARTTRAASIAVGGHQRGPLSE